MVRGLAHSFSDGEVLISCYAFGDPKNLAIVMVHETSHGFNHRYKSPRRLPSWLNEGIAEWIAQQVVVGDQTVRRKVEMAVQQMYRTRSLGGDFFTAAHIETWQYGAAASMIDFLLKYNPTPQPAKAGSRSRAKQQEPACFRKLIEGIKDGTAWEESLRQAYGLTPAELAQLYGQAYGIPGLQP
jgi:hypothetical protein